MIYRGKSGVTNPFRIKNNRYRKPLENNESERNCAYTRLC